MLAFILNFNKTRFRKKDIYEKVNFYYLNRFINGCARKSLVKIL